MVVTQQGEDADGLVNGNFGILDDAFIVSRALTPQQVIDVHELGAGTVLLPEPSAALSLAAGAALLGLLKRRRLGR